MKKEIKNLIKNSLSILFKKKIFPKFQVPEIQIEYKKEKIYGDYSTNIALKIGKIINKNPIEVAQKISSDLKMQIPRIFEKIEIAEPGFINFFISKECLQKGIKKVLKEKNNFGKLNLGRGKKVQVEFISANPTGPLHIGNGRGAFFGDTLSNILEKAGYKVIREYYINDAKVNTQIKILGKTALGRGVTYLTPDLKLKIKRLEPKLKKISDEGKAGHLLAQMIHKDIKNFIEKELKIKFDNWVSEEDLYKTSKVSKIYNWLKNKKLIYKREGAEWLKISQFGAPKDEVVVRKNGQPTYFLSDIAYHKDKFSRNFKKIINIWGADHQGHVPKIKAIAKILNYKGDLDILITQLVRLKRGKISKRKGRFITLKWLIDEVGLDAARFFYLVKSLDTQIEFDVELAKEKSEKSPVYYIQYAHARICSILRKIPNSKFQIPNKFQATNLKLLKHPLELNLIKELIRLPEVIEDTVKDYQVQRIPQYAMELATAFHQFYRDCKVLTADKNLREARIALVLATKIVLQNTLSLMGISAPKRM